MHLNDEPGAAYRTQVDVGRVDAGSKADQPELRRLYTEYASRTTAFSNIPVVLSSGLASYLVNFEHMCSEQILSSAMPRLVLSKWPQVKVFADALQPLVLGQLLRPLFGKFFSRHKRYTNIVDKPVILPPAA